MTMNQAEKDKQTFDENSAGSACTGNCSSPIRPYTSSDMPAEKASVLDFKGFWRYFRRMPDLKIIVPGWILLTANLLPRTVGTFGDSGSRIAIYDLTCCGLDGFP